ncbi:MAG: DNA gyrase/topoisomerase IV subunit A, partial [Flavobacteriales bacterium]|nr:DNA gyrase/topoisomerase IV subunit A [Flavobacteriales bacterium]
IDASIKYQKGKRFELHPDFPTGGVMDIGQYNDGLRGGKIRVRSKVSQLDKNTLIIRQIPFSTTTSSLIDSILKANDKGKIKIKRIEDNTAAEVEILIHLPANISPDKTIDALFAFTACETSISPLGCIIEDNKPLFIGVSEMLRRSTDNTVSILEQELLVKKAELEEQWHFASLERIFIENRIYRDIEEQETWEGVIKAIHKGLVPLIGHLKREVNDDDVVRLTEIRIKRISKFDLSKAQQRIDALEADLAQVKHDLANLTDFAISYFKHLKLTYGKGRERKTDIRVFDDVDAKKVVIRNTKLYVNREEGFVGTSLRRDEYVTDCADIDDIIVFTEDGKMTVTKVDAKTFIRKNIIHVAVFKKKDDRTIYNMIYRDGRGGTTYMKRFPVTSVTRDKEYDLTNGNAQSKVFYFSANLNGEAEIVTVLLRQSKVIKKLKWDVDFANLDIKSKGVRGNTVTKYTVNRIELKEEGVSTLKPRDIWFDETVGRLNVDGRGDLIGAFRGDDRLLIATQSGVIKTAIPDLNMHFPEDMLVLEKWEPNKPISVIYFDSAKERYFGKRFVIEASDKQEQFIKEGKQSQLELISTDHRPVFEIEFSKPRGKDPKSSQQIIFEDFISVKGIKAIGNQVTSLKVKQFNVLDPLPHEKTTEKTPADIEVEDPQTISNENDDDAQITLDL